MPRVAAFLVLATGIAASWLLGAGYGFNIPGLVCLLAATAVVTGRTTGRRPGWWSGLWGVSALGLLCLAAWRAEPGPYWLAVFCALALGALAVHGGRTWAAVVLAPVSFTMRLEKVAAWTRNAISSLKVLGRSRARNGIYAAGAALALLVVFGALFAGADPVFARFWDAVGSVFSGWSPLPVLWFLVGGAGALIVGYGAAAPVRWDRLPARTSKALDRNLWLAPLAVMAALFAVFDGIQVSVLFGGYRAVLKSTGMSYADYARQGFWQLIAATVLTLVVIGLAIRWSPRSGRRDGLVASITLCTLCVLALVIVGSALRRMELDIDAYGLTLPRVAVVAIEIWLGLLFLVLVAARCRPAVAWLPRGVALSAVIVLAAYVGIGPSHLVAQVDVNRYLNGQYIDLTYLGDLPSDAQPELDRLPPMVQACIADPQIYPAGTC
ncbi:MAG TPA: DUF4173 domain-containing protein [Actinocrinis sp.]|jgi:hypothetical protein